MPLFLGLDLGTSYFKAAVIAEDGALRGLGRAAVPRDQPAAGRSELPVAFFWSTLRAAIAEALNAAQATSADLAAVAYSSQATSFLLLDARDQPLTPLILWNDTRGESSLGALAPFVAREAFRQRVGYPAISGQSGLAKWHAFRQQQPAVWARTRRIMTLSDFLTFSLTGERAGDSGTAAFLGAFDLTRGEWWPEALDAAGVPLEFLSTPLRPGTPCGRTTGQATALLGLPAGRPFAVGSIDHHVSALGAGLGTFADVSISTGTVLAALALVAQVDARSGRFHGPDVRAQRYFRLTYDPAGAGQLEDYQRQHAPSKDIPALLGEAELAVTEDGRRVRRLLETITQTQVGLIQAATTRGDPGAAARPITVVSTGGGARSPVWLQIQADILNLPVSAAATPEPGCLGAAVFAAAAAGHYADLGAASAAMIRPGAQHLPRPGRPAT